MMPSTPQNCVQLLPPFQGGFDSVPDPGQRSFLAHPWAFFLHAFGVPEFRSQRHPALRIGIGTGSAGSGPMNGMGAGDGVNEPDGADVSRPNIAATPLSPAVCHRQCKKRLIALETRMSCLQRIS